MIEESVVLFPVKMSDLKTILKDTLKEEIQELNKGKEKPLEGDEMLTFKEAAQFIKKSKSTLYLYTSTNQICHYKTGRQVLFKKSDLIKWLDTKKSEVKTSEQILKDQLSNSIKNSKDKHS
jgi:excisionase family DNA binding protein